MKFKVFVHDSTSSCMDTINISGVPQDVLNNNSIPRHLKKLIHARVHDWHHIIVVTISLEDTRVLNYPSSKLKDFINILNITFYVIEDDKQLLKDHDYLFFIDLNFKVTSF